MPARPSNVCHGPRRLADVNGSLARKLQVKSLSRARLTADLALLLFIPNFDYLQLGLSCVHPVEARPLGTEPALT